MSVNPLRVLYIEDNPDDVELLRAYLLEVENQDVEILHAETLADAMKLLEVERVDAVLLDLHLPDSQGLDTFRTFASKYPVTPVIVLTVLDLEEVAMAAVRSGAQEYLVKGQLSGELVLKSIRYSIERAALKARLTQANEELELRIKERTHELMISYEALQQEIAESKRKGQEIEENQQLLQKILDGIGAAVLFVDPEAQMITDCNSLSTELLGFSKEELVGGCCRKFICFEKGESAFGDCPDKDAPVYHKEGLLEAQNGTSIPVLKTILPVKVRGKDLLAEIFLDLTERKALERGLAHAQKMEAVGLLAAGIAHEINTPTQYISGNLHFMKEAIIQLKKVNASCLQRLQEMENGDISDDQPDVAGLLEEMGGAVDDSIEGASRITSIVTAMKKFSHPDVCERKLVDLNEAVRNTVTITRNEWKYDSDVELQLDPDLSPVMCIPGDINQVLLNVLVNAAQAISMKVGDSGEKGKITITSRQEKGFVIISIRDTGCGISKKYNNQVFDPFFTTKEVGKGTGQGLAISYAIMEKHNGAISFVSEEGIGTTFTIRIPGEGTE